MSKKISISLTTDHVTNSIQIQFSPELQKRGQPKSSVVHFTLFVAHQEVGIAYTSFEEFDQFCLDLFDQHKKIMEIHNQK